MLSFIRRQMSATNLMVVAALIFAMAGGAFAANGGGGGSHASAQIAKKKGKKALVKRGPRGPKGPAGPAGEKGETGATGPQGPAGKNGTNGINGEKGEQGLEGKAGESVTEKTVLTSEKTKCGGLGGEEFVVGSGTPGYACNGKEGKPGNPAEFPEVLPAKRSETGGWEMSVSSTKYHGEATEPYVGFAEVSYPIPVLYEKEPTKVVYLKPGENHTTECPGTSEEPAAEPGYICLYAEEAFPEGAGAPAKDFRIHTTHNITVVFKSTEPDAYANGTWAMTPEP
jgi:hypothetical protein